MRKPSPTATITMSLTQDDMNHFIQQKAKQSQLDCEMLNTVPRQASIRTERIMNVLKLLEDGTFQPNPKINSLGEIYLNMVTKTFCDSLEELDSQIKDRPGYRRALLFNEGFCLIASGGYFTTEQAIVVAKSLLGYVERG